MPGTRKLGRATSHRTAMLRAMVTFLLENGKIETTVTRAKEVRSLAEKMITIAKIFLSTRDLVIVVLNLNLIVAQNEIMRVMIKQILVDEGNPADQLVDLFD